MNAARQQPVALLGGLYPFGDHVEIDNLGDGRHDAHHGVVIRQRGDEAAIHLQFADRQRFKLMQVVEIGVAHAEIVQRHRNAHRLQRAQQRHRHFGIAHLRGFGNLQHKAAGRNLMALQQALQMMHHAGVAQLHGGDVNAERDKYAALLPAGENATRLFEYPASDGGDNADLLGAGDKLFRQAVAAVRHAHAQQRLGASQLAGLHIDLRLQKEPELLVL